MLCLKSLVLARFAEPDDQQNDASDDQARR